MFLTEIASYFGAIFVFWGKFTLYPKISAEIVWRERKKCVLLQYKSIIK